MEDENSLLFIYLLKNMLQFAQESIAQLLLNANNQ